MTTSAMKRRNDTRAKLASMLTENTGRALCDSGDYYGRHWQWNQERDFEREPPSALEARIYARRDSPSVEISATLNLYHWLAERLKFNAYRQRCFEKWQARTGSDGQWPSIVEYVEHLPDAAGIYGESAPVTVNTYNGEDALSQTIHYVYWEDSDGAHVILQIHGGCDVRGGYTDGAWFDIVGDSELAIFDNARLSLGCPNDCVRWGSEDGGSSFHDSGNAYLRLKSNSPTWNRPQSVPVTS